VSVAEKFLPERTTAVPTGPDCGAIAVISGAAAPFPPVDESSLGSSTFLQPANTERKAAVARIKSFLFIMFYLMVIDSSLRSE
jgi:hypothetical protein